MNLRRRTFLQRLGLTLTALGVGETVAPNWVRRYSAALAEPNRRKLALLVGINQYPEQAVDPTLAQDAALLGAMTDVEMQRQLLLYRFGFQPADVMVLSNQQATRAGIQSAFESHLQQARAGDIVLLHFSGYGSQVRLAGRSGAPYRSLVPVDGLLPTEKQPAVADILELELQQWLQSLKTRQITTVIDAGYRDLGQLRWGTLRLRSRPTIPTGNLPTDLADTLPQADDSKSTWPGLLLRGSSPDRLVLEKDWSGFSAGVFTYALTQTLWETMPSTSVQVLIHRTGEALRRWTGPDQKPELTGSRQGERTFAPYSSAINRQVADAVVTQVDQETGKAAIWLGGLPAVVLEHLKPGSRLVAAATSPTTDTDGRAPVLKLASRSGLQAQASLAAGDALPEVGRRFYEQVRIYARSVELVVALDSNLERIERVDATSALSGIPFVSFTVSGEEPADCLFGRLPQVPSTTLTASLPADAINALLVDKGGEEAGVERSYGLFSPNRTLIPGTLIARDEAVKTAVNRLTPHLQSLLAMKLVRLTDNSQSSSLAVRAILETTRPRERLLLQRETLRSQPALPKSQLPDLVRAEVEDFEIDPNSRLRYRVSNYADAPLYFTLLSFDSRGQFMGLIPDLPRGWTPDQTKADESLDQMRVEPGTTQTLPENTMDWGIPPAAIWVETFLIVSTAPLRTTWQTLKGEEQETRRQPGLRKLTQPLKVAQGLLEDLHHTAVAANPELKSSDQYVLKTSTWATFSFRYAIAPTAP